MIASFFRRLEHHDVKWLLISGQASILYGAATFSEDIDLWLMPTRQNFERFVKALREVGARYYKLTPAFTVEHSARRHGFHFVLPATGKETECYLDVMGHPPRARAFEAALR
ncbi:MAG: hypothetical protein MJD61_08530, partial [Proteobacteria bacterium]|nr:hypothetical protein [Pseudomonadota bacterium]